RRNRWSDGDTFRHFFRSATIDGHAPKSVRPVDVRMLKHDPLTVGRNRRPRALARRKRQLLWTATVTLDSPDLKYTRAVGMENNITIIRSDNRPVIASTCRG